MDSEDSLLSTGAEDSLSSSSLSWGERESRMFSGDSQGLFDMLNDNYDEIEDDDNEMDAGAGSVSSADSIGSWPETPRSVATHSPTRIEQIEPPSPDFNSIRRQTYWPDRGLALPSEPAAVAEIRYAEHTALRRTQAQDTILDAIDRGVFRSIDTIIQPTFLHIDDFRRLVHALIRCEPFRPGVQQREIRPELFYDLSSIRSTGHHRDMPLANRLLTLEYNWANFATIHNDVNLLYMWLLVGIDVIEALVSKRLIAPLEPREHDDSHSIYIHNIHTAIVIRFAFQIQDSQIATDLRSRGVRPVPKISHLRALSYLYLTRYRHTSSYDYYKPRITFTYTDVPSDTRQIDCAWTRRSLRTFPVPWRIESNLLRPATVCNFLYSLSEDRIRPWSNDTTDYAPALVDIGFMQIMWQTDRLAPAPQVQGSILTPITMLGFPGLLTTVVMHDVMFVSEAALTWLISTLSCSPDAPIDGRPSIAFACAIVARIGEILAALNPEDSALYWHCYRRLCAILSPLYPVVTEEHGRGFVHLYDRKTPNMRLFNAVAALVPRVYDSGEVLDILSVGAATERRIYLELLSWLFYWYYYLPNEAESTQMLSIIKTLMHREYTIRGQEPDARILADPVTHMAAADDIAIRTAHPTLLDVALGHPRPQESTMADEELVDVAFFPFIGAETMDVARGLIFELLTAKVGVSRRIQIRMLKERYTHRSVILTMTGMSSFNSKVLRHYRPPFINMQPVPTIIQLWQRDIAILSAHRLMTSKTKR